MSFDPVVIEQSFNEPVSTLWTAITDQNEMRQWYFNQIADFQPEVGFETQFEVDCEGQIFRHMWSVTEVEPEKRLSYDWKYDGIPGQSNVVWEISETPDGCHLKLTHSGGETFPQDNPLFSRESGIAGWTYFIQENLPAYFEDRK